MDLARLDLKRVRVLLESALQAFGEGGSSSQNEAGPSAAASLSKADSLSKAGSLSKAESLAPFGAAGQGMSREPVPAAVLIAVVGMPGNPAIVLTRRTANLENHAGEVSLPGGRMEPGDASPKDAALRETFEEIGLAPEKVEILGSLPPYDTVSGFRVVPYVGWVEPPVSFSADPREVEEVFMLPLCVLLDRERWRREYVAIGDVSREFLILDYEGRRIWGATARILISLAEAVAACGDC